MFGATGFVGCQVVKSLAAAGFSVRAVTRTPDDDTTFMWGDSRQSLAALDGVTLVKADYGDADSLKAATAGSNITVSIAPAKGTPSPVEGAMATCAGIEAAAPQGNHIILLSHLGVVQPDALDGDSPSAFKARFGAIESDLTKAGPPHTILRQNYYHQNAMLHIAEVKAGKLKAPTPATGTWSSVDVADICEAVVAVAKDPAAHAMKQYNLVGSCYTMAGWAETFSNALGKTITYEQESDDEFKAILAGAAPDWAAASVIGEFKRCAEKHWSDDITDDLPALIGHKPADFGECLAGGAVALFK